MGASLSGLCLMANLTSFHITDLTTLFTLLLIRLVENLLVRRFFAKQLAVARTALFVFFLANKTKKEECAVKK